MARLAGPILAIPLACLVLTAFAPGATLAAVASCRVRNVTQETRGRSLIHMVENADDGDRLRVRGTCRGPIVIESDIKIRGVGERPTLTGVWHSRVVKIRRGARVTLRGLSIVRGYSGNDAGGGIVNRGRLTLEGTGLYRHISYWAGGAILNLRHLVLVDSTVTRNFACKGAGIWNRGKVAVRGSIVARNRAWDTESCGSPAGGGIMNAGELTLVDSRVAGNASFGEGGGISNSAGATVSLTSSTVARNEAWEGSGGGIWNGGDLTLHDAVVRGNETTADEGGGGIFNSGAGTVTLDASSSVAGNTPDDCVGTPAC
jgi:nitrous oxidase accessory protein NosD